MIIPLLNKKRKDFEKRVSFFKKDLEIDDIDFDFPNADDADSVPDAEINKYSLGVGGGEGILC